MLPYPSVAMPSSRISSFMPPIRFCAVLALLIILTFTGCAVSGTIIDTAPAPSGGIEGLVRSEAGEPAPDVEVFLDATARSARTDAEGRFVFADLPVAYYRIVALNESGAVFWEGVTVSENRMAAVEVAIDDRPPASPAGTNGRSNALTPNLASLLTGSIPECRIVNPDDVAVTETRRSAVLHRGLGSRGPIIVENEFTGFRIYIYPEGLDVFTQGDESGFRTDVFTRFEPMPASSTVREEAWEANRRRVYMGSLQHFLRSLAARNLRTDGFAVSRPFESTHAAPGISGLQETVATWTTVRDEQIVIGRPNDYVSRLNVPSTLRIAHRGASMSGDAGRYIGGLAVDDRPTSRISVGQGVVAFTRDGLWLEPASIVLEGLWGAPRFCHRLPVELFVATR